MTTQFQYKIFKKCLAVTFFLAKAYGFWLYKNDHDQRKIKYDFVRIAYSICFSTSLFCGYFAVGQEFLYSANKTMFVSFAFQLVFFVHTYIIVISCTSLFLNSYLEYEKRKFAYEKCKEVIDSLKLYDFKMLDIRKYLVLFIVKAAVIDALVFTTFWVNWIFIAATKSFYEFYILAFTFLPLMILRLYINLFYGGVLIIEVIFKQLNKNLNDLIRQASELYTKSAGKKKFSMRKHWELCEELEKISVLHAKLIDATKAFNSLFSVQMVLSVVSLLFILVLRFFYLYIATVELITKKGGISEIHRCISLCCSITLAWYDLYSTSSACDSLVTQVRIRIRFEIYQINT